jgi:flavorubredoxin
MHTSNYGELDPVELAPGVLHLGVKDGRNAWANIPYLVVEGDEAMVIDPGSAKPEFYACVLRKIHQVIDPRRIRYIVVQHQDPDLCAAVPLLEKLCHPDVEVCAPVEATLLLQHYGYTSPTHAVEDGETITLGGRRTISFFMTPYAHFIGSMVTYDATTKTLFSSDAFGGFTVNDDVYAGEDYPGNLTTFLGHYLGSKRALEYALKRVEQLAAAHGIERICPQHGCVIPEPQIATYLQAAHELKVGSELDRLAQKNDISLEWREERSPVTV